MMDAHIGVLLLGAILGLLIAGLIILSAMSKSIRDLDFTLTEISSHLKVQNEIKKQNENRLS